MRAPSAHRNNIRSKCFCSIGNNNYSYFQPLSAIDEFPDYLEDVMRSIVRLTGFSMSVVFGGPIPNAGGAISSAW